MPDWTCSRCGAPNRPGARVCSYCGSAFQKASPDPQPQDPRETQPGQPPREAPVPEGWRRFVDGWNGFSVLTPPGWQVVYYKGLISVRADPSGLTAAYLIPGRNVQHLPASGLASMYAQMIVRSDPRAQARLEPADPQHPERAHLRYRLSKMNKVIEGRSSFLVDGEQQLIMGFEAPAELVAECSRFAGPVLSSFKPEPMMPRQQFLEPTEGAFTACIPGGWQCQSQVNRNNPAGKGIIRFTAVGDPQPPSGMLREGRWMAAITDMSWTFTNGGGGLFNLFAGGNVLPYMPAVQFCQQWLPRLLPQIFPGQRPIGVYERTDIARAAEAEAAATGVQADSSVAILVTEADTPTGPVRQKTQVLTTIQKGAGFMAAPMWMAFLPGFYRAPASELEANEHILVGIIDSVQQTPAWKQREQQLMNNYLMQSAQWRSNMAMKTSQILSETSDIIFNSYNERQAIYDRISHNRSNAILGVQDMADSNGTVYSVPSGYDQYWIDPRGNIFGGDYLTKPGWDWNPMNEVKW